ncbi:MAG: ATPase, partial [Oscillospiraceae bacterium]|nr:ATPase [Oscillospiraceae bacterium]
MEYYTLPSGRVLEELGSDMATGLSSGEAEVRRERYGENALAEKPPKTLFQRFMAQFADILIIILLISAAISFAVSLISNEESYFEPILILVIVIINACIGVFQESKAEKALDALRKMSSPHARILRDGEEKMVDTKELVPG